MRGFSAAKSIPEGADSILGSRKVTNPLTGDLGAVSSSKTYSASHVYFLSFAYTILKNFFYRDSGVQKDAIMINILSILVLCS